MAKKAELSPEEKLLRVIQGTTEAETQDDAAAAAGAVVAEGGARPEAPKPAVAAPKVPETAKPAAPSPVPQAASAPGAKPAPKASPSPSPAPKTAEKPRLKEVTVPKPTTAKTESPAPVVSAEAPTADGAALGPSKVGTPGRKEQKASLPPVVPLSTSLAKHAPVRRSALKVVNRSLLAVAAAMLVMFGVEVWNGVMAVERLPQGGVARVAGAGELLFGGGLQPLETYTTGLSDFRIWHPDDVNNPLPPRTGPTPLSGPVVPWQTYCISNMNFIGMSGTNEAIIVDRKIERMYLVKVGQELRAGDHKIKLSAMGTDVVVVSDPDGRSKITLR
jgi:hypothetical protein